MTQNLKEFNLHSLTETEQINCLTHSYNELIAIYNDVSPFLDVEIRNLIFSKITNIIEQLKEIELQNTKVIFNI